MVRFMGGCAARLLGLALLAAVLAVGWSNRRAVVRLWDQAFGTEPQASEELADRAAARLSGLGRDGVTRVAFREPELQSLVLYRWAAALPSDLTAPRVGLGAGRINLEGQIPTARLGGIAELREILSFLPDTTSVRATASFVPLDGRHVALEIHELGAAGIPIPRRLIPPILTHFRLEGQPDVGPNSIAVPLPTGIGNVFVSGDSLVLVAAPSGGA